MRRVYTSAKPEGPLKLKFLDLPFNLDVGTALKIGENLHPSDKVSAAHPQNANRKI